MSAPARFDPPVGVAESLEPGLRRIVAGNPSPMTFRGTNTYLLGAGAVTVIDPGPDDPAHLAAVIGALGPGETVAAILVTHSHLDHSPLASPLARRTGAPVMAFGDALAGRGTVTGLSGDGGGEGVDRAFCPDIRLTDAARIETGAGPVTALWTPGHFGNHLCFAWRDRLFTGDLVMGWATSMISPPDGDLAAYMQSLDRLGRRKDAVYHPGHGAPVTDPAARLRELVDHRRRRERELLALLAHGPARIPDLTARIYREVPAALHPAAARNVLAHLIDLAGRGVVRVEGAHGDAATYALSQPPPG